jgi:hypothetical protein
MDGKCNNKHKIRAKVMGAEHKFKEKKFYEVVLIAKSLRAA